MNIQPRRRVWDRNRFEFNRECHFMSPDRQLRNQVKAFRQRRGWSQEELARRSGVSRPSVSAIEIERLAPSVTTAIALAAALACKVEDLFGLTESENVAPTWSWAPPTDPCRYWSAQVGGRVLRIPIERTAAGTVAHDGVFRGGEFRDRTESQTETTLVMASCDPAAAILANEYARVSGFRLLVLYRSSRLALELLRKGLVDVAGLHLASTDHESGNIDAASTILGAGFSLLRVARWQEGLALGPSAASQSVSSVMKSKLRWIGRESGSGARQCQDELLKGQPPPRRMATDHRGVAEAVRCGWADVGVCLRLVCEESGLKFAFVRDEAYDLCFSSVMENDRRIQALIDAVRSTPFRSCLADLPGMDSLPAGELLRLSQGTM
jgi:molybdate-binding protein/DNA-binding XRE family transcriptional regulator